MRWTLSVHVLRQLPIAFEGALKLGEISYIRAEGYPGGELKHGQSRSSTRRPGHRHRAL